MLEKLKTHRVVFLYAPTGSGKSLINLKVAIHRGSGYVTTPQTTLVDQYNADLNGKFTGLGSAVMGRKNYPCLYRHSLMLYPISLASQSGLSCPWMYSCSR